MCKVNVFLFLQNCWFYSFISFIAAWVLFTASVSSDDFIAQGSLKDGSGGQVTYKPCELLRTDPFLAAAEDQEGLDAVLLQIGISLTSETWFHLIVSIKILQGGLSDVDPPTQRQQNTQLNS